MAASCVQYLLSLAALKLKVTLEPILPRNVNVMYPVGVLGKDFLNLFAFIAASSMWNVEAVSESTG
jgi:hypothetical protein